MINSVGVVKYIDNLSEEEIKKVGIPNGIPLVFKFKLEGTYVCSYVFSDTYQHVYDMT